VVGSSRTEPSEGVPADVTPFLNAAGQPAIPGSSLRGMISAIYEAVTNSALRVLKDTLYSVRVPVEEALPHLGIVEENGIRMLNLPARQKVKGYEAKAQDELQTAADSFLAVQNPDSTSAKHPQPWFVPKDGNWRNAEPTLEKSSGSDIGGVLRVFGIEGREKRLPMKRKQEMFVPFGDDVEVHYVQPDVWNKFFQLADERTVEDENLPFQLKGAARNANPEAQGNLLRPQIGDLVFFRFGTGGRDSNIITEIAISQIWRRAAGKTFDYFKNIDGLLPFNPDRQHVTLAEQVFGFVEDMKAHPKENRQALAMAGRVRFFDAELTCPEPAPFFTYEPDGSPKAYVLKELSAPKPPCPAMYFTPRDQSHQTGLIPKTSLNPADHAPNGRKFYVHHPNAKDSIQAVSRDSDCSTLKRKAAVRPLRSRLQFKFVVDFDNLSDRELGFLLYALRPTLEYRHKLGMGKPLGLGTVRVDIKEVNLVDRSKRYHSDDPFAALRYHQIQKEAWVKDKVALVRNDPSYEIQFKTIEQIGNPANAGTSAVHYPQVAEKTPGTAGFEQELYEWFSANEKNKVTAQRKSLQGLTGSGLLPKLPRHNRHKGDD
jgi:CRISPR-associated protein (TIGR03986 family)